MTAKIHGNLGSAAPAANTDATLYAVPAGRKATGTLTVCNQNTSDVSIRFAIVPTGGIGSVAAKDYREFDTTVSAKGVLEKSAIPLTAGAALLVRASATNVSFNMDGIEEDA